MSPWATLQSTRIERRCRLSSHGSAFPVGLDLAGRSKRAREQESELEANERSATSSGCGAKGTTTKVLLTAHYLGVPQRVEREMSGLRLSLALTLHHDWTQCSRTQRCRRGVDFPAGPQAKRDTASRISLAATWARSPVPQLWYRCMGLVCPLAHSLLSDILLAAAVVSAAKTVLTVMVGSTALSAVIGHALGSGAIFPTCRALADARPKHVLLQSLSPEVNGRCRNSQEPRHPLTYRAAESTFTACSTCLHVSLHYCF